MHVCPVVAQVAQSRPHDHAAQAVLRLAELAFVGIYKLAEVELLLNRNWLVRASHSRHGDSENRRHSVEVKLLFALFAAA